MTRGAQAVAAVAVAVALMATAVLAVRASYGAFKGGYTLTATFDRATYGFGINTEIDYLGVEVGHVTHIRLQPNHLVEAYLKIDAGFKVPDGTNADVHDRSLFGDPYVALVLPAAPPNGYLVGGDHIAQTSVDADTTDLIATASPLLDQINGHDLLTLVTELDQATQGEGHQIAQSIQDGAQLTNLYATTIDAQIQALNTFSAFQTALTPDAGELNTLAQQTNDALPTLNAAEGDFQQALQSVQAFSNKLADVISEERPNIDALLDRGDNVVRLLAIREPQIEQVVSGLAEYLQKFALGAGPETLPNGTKFVYFKNFVELSDIQNLICGLVDPAQGGAVPAAFQPLIAALSGTALGCKPVLLPDTKSPPAALPPSAKAAASDLMQQIAGQIGAPEPPGSQTETVGQLLDQLLGNG